MAQNGLTLDERVEKIVVLDATDIGDLPTGVVDGVDYAKLWSSGTRVLLRKGENQREITEARKAAEAARAAAKAAEMAADAAETGDADKASKAASDALKIAKAGAKVAKKEMDSIMDARKHLESLGCTVSTVPGSRPRDVMEHLGEEGKKLVVWRAGCWGERGVQSIEAGAFQSISAHIAVGGEGGIFWQTIVAEQCVQGACGARSRIEVKSNGDISLEYCDEGSDDEGCVVTREGHRVRHVRLDCDIKLVDELCFKPFVRRTGIPSGESKEVEGPWFL